MSRGLMLLMFLAIAQIGFGEAGDHGQSSNEHCCHSYNEDIASLRSCPHAPREGACKSRSECYWNCDIPQSEGEDDQGKSFELIVDITVDDDRDCQGGEDRDSNGYCKDHREVINAFKIYARALMEAATDESVRQDFFDQLESGVFHTADYTSESDAGVMTIEEENAFLTILIDLIDKPKSAHTYFLLTADSADPDGYLAEITVETKLNRNPNLILPFPMSEEGRPLMLTKIFVTYTKENGEWKRAKVVYDSSINDEDTTDWWLQARRAAFPGGKMALLGMGILKRAFPDRNIVNVITVLVGCSLVVFPVTLWLCCKKRNVKS